MKKFLVLACSAFAIFAAGSLWLALYPFVPADLGGVESLDARAERLRIPVGEDDHLDGRYLPGTKAALVLLFPGYARDHRRMWRYAHFLHAAGYAVLTVDFRSTRLANRKPTTLGFWELADARATLDWVHSQPRFDGWGVALLGESLGGSVALVLAAERPEVLAVVADCPFSSGMAAIEDGFSCELKLPAWLLAPISRGLGTLITGHDPAAFDVTSAVRRLGRRPVLLIQTTRADRFSLRQVTALNEASGTGTERWTLDDVAHTGGWTAHRAAYESRVLGFLAVHVHAGVAPGVRHENPVASGAKRGAHAVASGARSVGRAIAKPFHKDDAK